MIILQIKHIADLVERGGGEVREREKGKYKREQQFLYTYLLNETVLQ